MWNMLEVTLVEPLSHNNLFYYTTSYTLFSSFPVEMGVDSRLAA